MCGSKESAEIANLVSKERRVQVCQWYSYAGIGAVLLPVLLSEVSVKHWESTQPPFAMLLLQGSQPQGFMLSLQGSASGFCGRQPYIAHPVSEALNSDLRSGAHTK